MTLGTKLSTLALALAFTSTSATAGTVTTDDAFVTMGSPKKLKKQHGGRSKLRVKLGVANTFLMWDLSDLPPGDGTDIAMATLRVWISEVNEPGSFALHPVTEAWDEDTITGDTMPALGAAIATGIAVDEGDADQFLTIDVTSLVQDWIDGVTANHGVALVPESGHFVMDSKENRRTGHEPSLDLSSANPSALSATSTAFQSTTSTTDVAMTGLSLTPGAGNYVALLSADVDASAAFGDDEVVVSLYVNGVQVAGSERRTLVRLGRHASVSVHAVLTGVNDAEAVEAHWRTVAGDFLDLNARSLILMKVR